MSSYLEKIDRAVAFIEKNLSQELNWRHISKECGISEFHFHRIFSALMKETPGNFIIRKKLEYAMGRIAYGPSEKSLLDIALNCGYSSQSNFNKAFKAYFGVTPSQVQEGKHPQNSKIGKIKSKYGKEFKVDDLYPKDQIADDPKNNEVKMNVKIENFPIREVIYQSSVEGYKKESIYQVWSELINSLVSLGNAADSLIKFGVGHDNPQVTPEEKCRYDACILADSLKEVPGNIKKMQLPAGKYACFYFKGSSQELLQLYLDIYKNWFVKNGYEPGDFPLIERYISVDQDNPDADIELETQFLLK